MPNLTRKGASATRRPINGGERRVAGEFPASPGRPASVAGRCLVQVTSKEMRAMMHNYEAILTSDRSRPVPNEDWMERRSEVVLGMRFAARLHASHVDAVLDTVDEDDSPATALADLLDKRGEWDWSDDSDHDPSDRTAVVESSGAWWAVYRGTEADEAHRCASEDEARAVERKWIEAVQS